MQRRAHAVAALALAAGCAHTPDLPLRPDPAPPPGSETDSTYIARDDTHLFVRHWPATGETRGVLVIMHGLKDHSARYADLAAQAAAHGFSVYAFDLRGHGRSAGPRVAPAHWTDYVDDLDLFLTRIQEKEPGKPVFLFGHSMGGAIAARAAEIHQKRRGRYFGPREETLPAPSPIAGLILSGPALAIDAPPLLIAATRMTGALMPSFPALDLKNGDFSSDPAAKAAMDRDELISQPPAPARTAAGLVDGIEWIWTDIDFVTMPVLALHGTADRLTAPAGSRMFIDAVPAQDKTLRIYPGLFHDLIHEPKGAQVVADILAWLDAHTGGPAVAAPPRYDGPLAGDPKGWAQAVELGAGVSHSIDDDQFRFAGDFTLALARPRPIGWHGLFTARWASSNYAVDLRPLGIAVRFGGAVLGVSGGAALVRGVSGPQFGASGGLWYEQPLGPAHFGIRADYEHAFASGARNAGWLLGTVRFGGDRSYWPHARAGVGPIISGGYECAFADICSTVLLAGFELYGAD